MKAFSTGMGVFWVTALGAITLFIFFAALGAFDPGEVMWLTIGVGALAVVSVIPFIHLRHAIDDGRHAELARSIHAMREHRGF